jgi:hypothetical protein
MSTLAATMVAKAIPYPGTILSSIPPRRPT